MCWLSQIALLSGLGAALLIGTMARFYPAIEATRLPSTEALRNA
jgi:ABC-type lipoprotein release transport system permease subunit